MSEVLSTDCFPGLFISLDERDLETENVSLSQNLSPYGCWTVLLSFGRRANPARGSEPSWAVSPRGGRSVQKSQGSRARVPGVRPAWSDRAARLLKGDFALVYAVPQHLPSADGWRWGVKVTLVKLLQCRDLRFNRIREIPRNTFKKPRNLNTLYFYKDGIRIRDKQTFKGLTLGTAEQCDSRVSVWRAELLAMEIQEPDTFLGFCRFRGLQVYMLREGVDDSLPSVAVDSIRSGNQKPYRGHLCLVLIRKFIKNSSTITGFKLTVLEV
ncbi:probable oxidoreductase PXDNL [Kogia breviceps]|uniref:probable oxidoreductase PXDNL n=1 Tax=Kogia breviceps TaxID=27615 RepID=UPI0034D22FAF